MCFKNVILNDNYYLDGGTGPLYIIQQTIVININKEFLNKVIFGYVLRRD